MGGNIPWLGKPHLEQGQIGIHWCGSHWIRVGRLRPVVTQVPDEWLSKTEPGLSADSLISINCSFFSAISYQLSSYPATQHFSYQLSAIQHFSGSCKRTVR